MRLATWAMPCAILLMGCEPQAAGTPRMSVADAETYCTERAKRYANTPLLIAGENGVVQVGLLAELPDSFMVNDFYKRCYFANAGQRPESIPKLPAFG